MSIRIYTYVHYLILRSTSSIHTYTHTYTYKSMCVYIHAYAHAYIHTRMHTYRYALPDIEEYALPKP